MAITFHPNGDITGTGASNFGSSGQIIQIKTDTRSGSHVDITHAATELTAFGANLEVSITFHSTSNKFVAACFIPDVYNMGSASRAFHGGFSYSTDNFGSDTVMGGASVISDYIGWQGSASAIDLNEATYTTSGNCPTTSAIKIRPHFTTVNGDMRLMANSVGIAHLTVMEIKA